MAGVIVDRIIKAVRGEELSVTCHALGSSPAANLSWRINDKSVNYEAHNYTKNKDGTFDSMSTLQFYPEWEDKSVECVSTLGGSGAKKAVRGILIFYEKADVESVSYVIWIALSCCVAGLILISNIVVYLKRKLGVLQTANLRTRNTGFSLASLSPSNFRKTPKEADVDGPKPPKLELPKIPTGLEQPEYAGYDTEIPKSRLNEIPFIQEDLEDAEYETELPKQRDSPEYETELIKQSDDAEYETKLSKLQLTKLPKLPAIPKSSEKEIYSECEFKDPPSESYSTSLNDVTQAKIFYERDMHKTKKLKMGKLYNRWMGTINVSSDKSKPVLFTTLTDEVFRLNKVHWDKFVKRVVQLPKSRNLCKIEGIGIDNAKQYLIHEKLSWKLNERITANFKADDGTTSPIQISPPEAMRFILGILEGMELIQSSGFLHPGLSTKKILLTNKRHCQLYDFCLKEDAMNILAVRKPKMSYGLNELAPEGKEKNKYTSASDVWSTAVVIWEILSGGLPPFHDKNVGTTFQSPPQTWPKDYQQLSNILLFDCWDYNESLRPSIHELRLSFQEILKSVDTYNLPEVYSGSMAGWYVPMKEAGT